MASAMAERMASSAASASDFDSEAAAATGSWEPQGIWVARVALAASLGAGHFFVAVPAIRFLPFGRSGVLRDSLPSRRPRPSRAGLRLPGPRVEEELSPCGGEARKRSGTGPYRNRWCCVMLVDHAVHGREVRGGGLGLASVGSALDDGAGTWGRGADSVSGGGIGLLSVEHPGSAGKVAIQAPQSAFRLAGVRALGGGVSLALCCLLAPSVSPSVSPIPSQNK